MKKVLCVCMSATYQRTVVFEKLALEKINRSHHYGLYASGKAVNSARVLAQLEKGSAVTVCPLGQENSAQFIDLAQKDGLDLWYVDTPGKIRDCWTLLDSTAHTTTEIIAGEPVPQDEYSGAEIKFLKLITEKLDECDAMLLAGSRQGKWSSDIYAVLCGIALDKGKIVLADFIGDELKCALKSAVPSIVKINGEEFEATFDLPANQENICAKSLEYNNIFVITRGTDSTLAADHGKFFECPVQKLKAVNTIACGDSFNAGFLHEYLKSGDMEKALEKVSWCASKNALSEVPGSIK